MLKNKVVVVTGGAGLIGQEFIKTIAENNGVAVIADTNERAGQEFKVKLSNKLNSSNICFVNLDMTSKISITAAIDKLNKDYGRIDALVNNAYPKNKGYGQHFFDVEYNNFIENIGLNIGGYFLASQTFSGYFKTQGYGNIINISSIYGLIAPRFEVYENTNMTVPVEYAAIKSAILHLTRYMAKYFKGMNIRVNAISPGGILDNQPEPFRDAYNEYCLTKGMLDKSDLNGTLLFLLSELSKHVNGQNILVDDGYCL